MSNVISQIPSIPPREPGISTGLDPFEAIPNSVASNSGAGVALSNGVDTDRLLTDPAATTIFGVNKYFAAAIVLLAGLFAWKR